MTESCERHRMAYEESYYPFGCPVCNRDYYLSIGYVILNRQERPMIPHKPSEEMLKQMEKEKPIFTMEWVS